MSERVLAIIWIGGRLELSRAGVLIDAINSIPVFAGDGDNYFQPRSVEDLIVARAGDGRLHLADDSAPSGELPAITAACIELGLSYRLWHEAMNDCGAEVTWWEPGMKEPGRAPGDNCAPHVILVDSHVIEEALGHLRANDTDAAVRTLDEVVTRIEPPRFELVATMSHESVADGR